MIIQNQYNPIAPKTTATHDQLLNSYEQQSAAIRGELQEANPLPLSNPFKSNYGDEDVQQKAISAREQLLAPIGGNIYDAESSYTDAKHQKYLNNVNNDPTFTEVEPALTAYLAQMRGEVAAGRISLEDAFSDFARWGQENIDPVMDKHHHKDSPSHKTTLHDDQPYQTPEIIKRAKAKGAK